MSKLSERQFKLLSIIVDDYIKFGEPVSSLSMLEKNKTLNISSATIRNEMMSLEKYGYLEKPSHSSGRVPTNKAYEWHVREIKSNPNNIEFIKAKIVDLFEKRNGNIDAVLDEAINLINKATHTTTLKADFAKKAELEDMKLYRLEDGKVLVLLVFSNGRVINNEVSLKDVSYQDLSSSINIMFERLKGTTIDILFERAKTMKELILANVKGLEKKFQELITLMFNNLGINNYKYLGLNNIVTSDYLKSFETMKKLMEVIENNSIWSLIQKSKTIQTADANITLDLDDKELNNISVITKDIDLKDSSRTLAFVGPKNQDYKVLIELLKILEEKLKSY